MVRGGRRVRVFYPFYRPYGQSEPMSQVIRYVVRQMNWGNRFYVNEDIGLIKSAFDKNPDRFYDPQKASTAVAAFHDRMLDEFHCDPAKGDALIMAGVKEGWTRFID